jgi:Flp pilus assembly pilin Flp
MSMRRHRSGHSVQDSGQALIEYALILALASLGIVSALMILQGGLGNSIQASGRRIDAVAGGPAGQSAGAESGTAGGTASGGEDSGTQGPNGRK